MEYPNEEDLRRALLASDEEGPALLQDAITQLTVGSIDPDLAVWLAQKLECIAKGDNAQCVFGLTAPSNAPKQWGSHRVQHDQFAALYVLAQRKTTLKQDAQSAVAKACGIRTRQTVERYFRDGGYKHDQVDWGAFSNDALTAMAGEELVASMNKHLSRAKTP